jgi:hypothetical protein
LADEWKVYNNEMIKDIEGACTDSDRVSNLPTNCVAVAEDVAPTVTEDSPREALHKLQILLRHMGTNCLCHLVLINVNFSYLEDKKSLKL